MNLINKTFFAAALLLVGASQAQAADQKIGVVDVQGIFQALPQAVAIQQDITEEFKDQTEELKTLEGDLKFNMEKHKRDAATMSEKEMKTLEEKILKQRQEYAEKGQALQQKMQGRFGEERNKLMALIKQTIDAIAADEKYDIILNAGAVVYIDESQDLSRKVVERVSKIK
ncbi:OmpH family outer membrane protein [Paraneptunicella aestuarii]|uniref:OmpH family outer membrane protein n=1 Tax=Paraneptunicella aestuarii TaxID=2831148 RepID=UPI001E4EF525|nr:OmpH family outer membrane protein [Paraneptunicella aestuarii]UAA39714.1 OmpH family outer membrane protein [Paraneptunicella aestuarii]